MTDRATLATAFLTKTDFARARRTLLAGDASNRRYERLQLPNGATAVLMDAPPDKGEDVRPFMAIATYLSSLGLSAPGILAHDEVHGFLILEDLGDDLFARVLERRPDLEPELYAAATDVLITLHCKPPPDLPLYDGGLMTELAALAFTRYATAIAGSVDASEFIAKFRPLLDKLTKGPCVLIQRDYHAENLLWLPGRDGLKRVGLLDFQDAMLGHPAYDLVSVLQDARRDVSPEIETAMIDRYIASTNSNKDDFIAAYAASGVQRNLRILGVFARLSLDHGKAHYVDLIPRVWGLLQRDLAHPALAAIATLARDALPEPTPEALEKLRPQ